MAWPSAEGFEPFSTMFLTKLHIFGWPLVPRLETKVDQACRFAAMINFLFSASAFFHSIRLARDSGDTLHSLKAFRAFFITSWHDSFHHGRVGFLVTFAFTFGLVFLK